MDLALWGDLTDMDPLDSAYIWNRGPMETHGKGRFLCIFESKLNHLTSYIHIYYVLVRRYFNKGLKHWISKTAKGDQPTLDQQNRKK
jgi:hypothetical protein